MVGGDGPLGLVVVFRCKKQVVHKHLMYLERACNVICISLESIVIQLKLLLLSGMSYAV